MAEAAETGTPKPAIEAIRDIELLNPANGEKVKASSLWQDKPCLVQLVRRPGCMFCREEAAGLASLRPTIEGELGIAMVAVTHERQGVEEFREAAFKGPVFVDAECRLFAALHGGRAKKLGALGLFKPAFWGNLKRAWGKGARGNMSGDGSVLGGLMLVGKGEAGVLYNFEEKNFGDHAPQEDLLRACQSTRT